MELQLLAHHQPPIHAEGSSQGSCLLPAMACAYRHSLPRSDVLLILENTQIQALVLKFAPPEVPAQATALLQEQHSRRQRFYRMQLQEVKSSTGAPQGGYSKGNTGAEKNNVLAQSPGSFCAGFWLVFRAETAALTRGVCLLNHLKVSVPCSSFVTKSPVVLSHMIASQMENEEWL